MTDVKRQDKSARVIVWCVPRSASTVLAKCLNAIEGNMVWLEPYTYGFFAKKMYDMTTQKELPMDYEGNEEAYAEAVKIQMQQPQAEYQSEIKIHPERLSFANIKKGLESSPNKYVLVKDMGFGINRYRNYIPTGYRHTFLIRDPSRVYVSFRKGLEKEFADAGMSTKGPSMDIIEDDLFGLDPPSFFKQSHELWNYVRQNLDPNSVVIDTYDLLSQPDKTLRAYCEAVGLPYSDSLLSWSPSVDESRGWRVPADGALAGVRNFYGTAVQSTHFMAPRESGPIPRDQLTDDVIRCVDESMPFYEEMYQHRIQV